MSTVTTVAAVAVSPEMAATGKTTMTGKTTVSVAEVEAIERLMLSNWGEDRLAVPVVPNEVNEATRAGLVCFTDNESVLRCGLGWGRCD